MERRLHTLVETVPDHVKGSSPVDEGEELGKVVFPGFGEMFIQS